MQKQVMRRHPLQHVRYSNAAQLLKEQFEKRDANGTGVKKATQSPI